MFTICTTIKHTDLSQSQHKSNSLKFQTQEIIYYSNLILCINNVTLVKQIMNLLNRSGIIKSTICKKKTINSLANCKWEVFINSTCNIFCTAIYLAISNESTIVFSIYMIQPSATVSCMFTNNMKASLSIRELTFIPKYTFGKV